MSRAIVRISALAAVLVLGAGCARDRGPGLEQAREALAAAAVRPGVVLVEVRRSADDAPGLTIERAVVAPGAAPRLVDDPALDGRFELLDRDGRPLWTMGYRPLGPGSGGAPLRLRAPRIDGAVQVRLTEAGGKIVVEAPLGD